VVKSLSSGGAFRKQVKRGRERRIEGTLAERTGRRGSGDGTKNSRTIERTKAKNEAETS
jgi:hypothetical protein